MVVSLTDTSLGLSLPVVYLITVSILYSFQMRRGSFLASVLCLIISRQLPPSSLIENIETPCHMKLKGDSTIFRRSTLILDFMTISFGVKASFFNVQQVGAQIALSGGSRTFALSPARQCLLRSYFTDTSTFALPLSNKQAHKVMQRTFRRK
jgi:hypothetical protein